jgi:hypothetical protein
MGIRKVAKTRIRDTFFRIAPETAAKLFSARSRRISQALLRALGIDQLNQKLSDMLGNRVLAGPCAGMVLSPMTFREQIGPCLLGTYESELHPWLAEIFQQRFAQILDVGAKFGYYAVGLARRYPDTPVVAFDPDPWARAALREMSTTNETKNVLARPFCSPQWLRRHLRQNALIFSDCEGYEVDLLCGMDVPSLASATMIIETHDCLVPGITRRIHNHFAATHVVRAVETRARDVALVAATYALTLDEARMAVEELRPQQTFLMLTPRSDPGTRAGATLAEDGAAT